jgi:tetratricopeptide (TPR) repeat protein
LGKIEDEKEALDWNNKGNSLFQLGKYEESIACYDEATAWNNKGNVLKKLGRDEEAEQCFANVKRLQK